MTTLVRRLAAALALAACALAAGPGAAGAQLPITTCQTNFSVLHDDAVGALRVPAGDYRLSTSELTCDKAAALFSEFLQDYSGALPTPWALTVQGVGQATFRRGGGAGNQFFTVVPEGGGGGGGGGGGNHGALACPSSFTVLDNDRIGALRLRAGRYRITLNSPRITCAQASAFFTRFLQDYDGRLGGGWTVLPDSGEFVNGSTGYGFRVKSWTGSGGGGGGKHPATGSTRCRGTFRVLNDDRIGALRLARGPYYVTTTGSLSCAQASTLFTRFLRDTAGDLPSPWRVTAATGAFRRGSTTAGFTVKPAFVLTG